MALELVYTSSTRGLREGTSGFCTVAMTRALPPALVPRLEALGGYRPGPSGNGPVALSFWRLETANGVVNVLTRVGPAAPDHTQRSNKLATYLVLGADEQPDSGPARLLTQMAMRSTWEGPARWLDDAVPIPASAAAPPAPCRAWTEACGDAGWAGVLASAFLRDMGRPAHIIYREGTDALALIDEAARLLPTWARWRATFSTYFVQPVAGAPCCWRFCLDGTPAADAARGARALLIDLTRPMGEAQDSRYVRAARTGVLEPAEGAEDRAAVPAAMGADAAGARNSANAWADTRVAPGGEPSARGAKGATGIVAPESAHDAPRPAAARAWRPKPVLIFGIAAVATMLTIATVAWLTGRGDTGPSTQLSPEHGEQTAKPTPSGAKLIEPTVTEPAVTKPAVEPIPVVAPPEIVQPAIAPPAVTPPAVVPPPEPPPSAAPSAGNRTELPWIVLAFVDAPEGIVAVGAIPPTVHAATVQFAPPSALLSGGLVARGSTLEMPNSAGSAHAELAAGALRITLPVIGNSLETLSGVIKLPASARAPEYGRAALRRVPLDILDESGMLVARARVEAAISTTPPGRGQNFRSTMRVVEPALHVETHLETRAGRMLLEAADCGLGATVQLKGRSGVVQFAYENSGSVNVTPEQWVDETAMERTRLGADAAGWIERQTAAKTLAKRTEGISISDAAVASALVVVGDSLNADERKLLRDTKGNERSLQDTEVLRAVLPVFMERCKKESKRVQEAMRALSSPGPTQLESVVTIDVAGQDGFLLTTFYPEGHPR